MSSNYLGRSRQGAKAVVTRTSYSDSETEETVPDIEEAPKKRRAPGTSEFVTMKISQSLYGPLKTIASLTGKTSSELLDEIVRNGLDQYKNLTINELLNK